jgi:hypothetical protein
MMTTINKKNISSSTKEERQTYNLGIIYRMIKSNQQLTGEMIYYLTKNSNRYLLFSNHVTEDIARYVLFMRKYPTAASCVLKMSKHNIWPIKLPYALWDIITGYATTCAHSTVTCSLLSEKCGICSSYGCNVDVYVNYSGKQEYFCLKCANNEICMCCGILSGGGLCSFCRFNY